MSTEWISDGFWFHQHPTLKSLKLDEVCLDVAINDPEPLTVDSWMEKEFMFGLGWQPSSSNLTWRQNNESCHEIHLKVQQPAVLQIE